MNLFISIYNKNNDTYNTFSLIAKDADRISNKDYIVEEIAKKLLTIFRNS